MCSYAMVLHCSHGLSLAAAAHSSHFDIRTCHHDSRSSHTVSTFAVVPPLCHSHLLAAAAHSSHFDIRTCHHGSRSSHTVSNAPVRPPHLLCYACAATPWCCIAHMASHWPLLLIHLISIFVLVIMTLAHHIPYLPSPLCLHSAIPIYWPLLLIHLISIFVLVIMALARRIPSLTRPSALLTCCAMHVQLRHGPSLLLFPLIGRCCSFISFRYSYLSS